MNGTTYNDANTYYLDQAAKTPLVNFTWFLDTYGNVIGSAKVAATYTYAILKSLTWNFGTGGANGSAVATLVNAATGEETTASVKSIDGSEEKTAGVNFAWNTLDATPYYTGDINGAHFDKANSIAYVAPETFKINDLYKGYALYRVNTLSTGAVVLEGVDNSGEKAFNVVNHATGVEYVNQATSLYANGTYNPVNDATVFTVLGANNTYKQYVGKMNMPTIKNAEIFYVNANGDSYVDYVYVKDCTVDNSGKSFVMATSNTYYGNLYNDANVYVLKNALVNGEAKEDAVMTTDKTVGGYNAFQTIVAGVNHPFFVTYDVNGYLNSATAFTTAWNGQLTPAAGATNLYYGIISVKDADVANGTLVSSTNDTFFVNNVAEKVIGDYTKIADVKDWSAVTVYLVYSVDAAHFNNRVVSQLYVMDKGNGGSEGTNPIDNKGSIHYTVNVLNSVNGTPAKYGEFTSKNLTARTYTTADYPVEWILTSVGFPVAEIANYNVDFITPSVEVTVGGTAEVVLNIVHK